MEKHKPGDTILNRYHVDSVIGEGGMGIVYKVMDNDRIIALKTIKQEFQKHVLSHPYFVGEAQVAFDVKHENIIEVFEISKSPCYIKMEYIDGGHNLQKWMSEMKKNIDPPTVFQLIRDICKGLQYLHDEKIVHRDIKPSNILLQKIESQLVPKIGDFGVSKKMTSDGKLINNQVCGDDRFKAPEMTPGSTIDHKVDVYAIGVISYELLTNKTYSYENKIKTDILEPDQLEVFKRVLHNDPETRPEAMEFFQELDQAFNKTMLQDVKKNYKNVFEESTPKSRDAKIPVDAIYPTDEKYAFTINEDSTSPITYYFVLDTDKKPIKLGDGTFGVVFCVYESTAHQRYAVKLFYKTQPEDTFDEEAKVRFDFESDSLSKINKKLRNGPQNMFAGLVMNKGGTKKFTDSGAYATFQEHFKSLKMGISRYAIVMDQYDFTLKELLENGTDFYTVRLSYLDKILNKIPHSLYEVAEKAKPKRSDLEDLIKKNNDIGESDKKQLLNNISECNGYDILKNMDFSKRIKTILPFIFSIAQGLRALHLVDMYHLDLKPGNIFVKKVGGVINAVLGDLGFLAPQSYKVSSVATFHNILPLGTKHYRSPEQKDYFDICDVEIIQRKTYKDQYNIVLIARDPKFKNSIIEKGDWLFFSKDSEHKRYIVHDIYEETDTIVIEIRNSDKTKTSVKELRPDKSTQVIIYKNQQIRTDLFGFGALIFDMFTGGQSAEQFYDNIRIYDVKEWDRARLVSEYKKVSSNQSSDHSLIHAFKPFKHMRTSEYAPSSIVELILNCMLYKAKGTFFYESRDDVKTATELLFESVTKLLNEYQMGDSINNDLFDPKINTTLVGGGENNIGSAIQKLNKYKPDNSKDYASRLSEGIWYFRELVNLTQDTLISDSGKKFLAQMLPENIEQKDNRELIFSNFVYTMKDIYLSDLKEDRAYTSIPGDGKNPYILDYITFMRREIKLIYQENETNRFKFSFFDALSTGDEIEIDDWILINKDLWQVKAVEKDYITINKFNAPEEVYAPSEEERQNEHKKHYVFYRNIEPCQYYLEMLGIYLYNIFFVEVGEDTSKKPMISSFYNQMARLYDNWSIIHLISNNEPAELEKKYVEMIQAYDEKIFKSLNKQSQLLIIHLSLVYLYFKLTFYRCSSSYYQEFDDKEQRILEIKKYVDKIQEMIELFLDLGTGKLNLGIKKIEEVIKKSNFDDYQSTFSEINSFNSLFRNVVFVDLSNTDIGKKPNLRKGVKWRLPLIMKGMKK